MWCLQRPFAVIKQRLQLIAVRAFLQELRTLNIPEVFGRDVVVTQAFGFIDAKFVLHAAIEKYQEKSSLDVS